MYVVRMCVLLGHTPVVIFLKGDLGPAIVSLLYIPCAVMLYVTPQCSELTVTIAIPLLYLKYQYAGVFSKYSS